MSAALLFSIIGAGFAVAFLHAALPTHWLPFAVTARGQGWGMRKTLTITALAGVGHVILTSILGALVVGLGLELSRWTGGVFPFIAGGVLVAFGLFYLVRQARGGGHVHLFGGHAHPHEHPGHEAHVHAPRDHDAHQALPDLPMPHASQAAAVIAAEEGAGRRSDRAAILSLLALLAFSPCESFLPVFLSGVKFGWRGFAVLSVVLGVGTIAAMVTFTALSLVGLSRLRMGALARYEGAILGVVLCVLGVARGGGRADLTRRASPGAITGAMKIVGT